jgi:uncharacterized membrane protein HdeD (DUF308 family)
MSTLQFPNNPIAAGFNEVRKSWGWFLAVGILFMLAGAACIVFNVTATFATVMALGWILLFSGVVALVHAFRVGTWSGAFPYVLSALFRGFTGFMLLRYPDIGAASLTIIVASFFIVTGLFRAIGSAMLKLPRWGWSMFSGIVSVALGVMLLAQLPVSSLWFIGFAVGVEMLVEGAALIAFSSALQSLPKAYETKLKAA